ERDGLAGALGLEGRELGPRERGRLGGRLGASREDRELVLHDRAERRRAVLVERGAVRVDRDAPLREGRVAAEARALDPRALAGPLPRELHRALRARVGGEAAHGLGRAPRLGARSAAAREAAVLVGEE